MKSGINSLSRIEAVSSAGNSSTLQDRHKPKVSVVIPVYKVEPYINMALESVCRQTLTDIEIIAVNDGSPDRCGEIIDEYAQRDPRIKAIHKKNGGYGSAVNAGIRAATGDYIAIMEPDDYIIDDLYYILHQIALKHDLDICRYNAYLEVRNFMAPVFRATYYPGQHVTLSEVQLAEMFGMGHAGVWMGIYRRSLLIENDVWMDEGNAAFHDVDFVAMAYLAAARIQIVELCGYYYRRDVPTQSVSDITRAYCMLRATQRIQTYLSNRNMPREIERGLYGYIVTHLLHYFQRVENLYPNSPLSKIFLAELNRYLGDTASTGLLLSDEKSAALNGMFETDIDAHIVQLKAIVTLSELSPLQMLRHSGEMDLAQVYCNAYYKLCLFLSDPSGSYSDALYDEFKALLTATMARGNFTMLEVVRKLLEVIPQATLLWQQPDKFVDLISYLIESGDHDAIELYWVSKNVNPKIDVSMRRYPLALKLIYEHKQYAPNAELTYALARKSEATEEKFLSYIAGKSVAVVGNSPCEKGLKKGAEIDDHDIVIRFNNYELNEKIAEDYGSKEHVWVMSPNSLLLLPRPDVAKYEFIATSAIGRDVASVNAQFYSQISDFVNFFRMDAPDEVRAAVGVVHTTLGVYTLAYLMQHIGLIKKLSIYGFDLTDHLEGKRHYFGNDPFGQSGSIHNWRQERRYLDAVVSELAVRN